MSEIRVKIRAQAPSVIEDLFGSPEPQPLQRVQITSDAEVVHQRHTIRQGFVESGVIIDLLLKIGAGVATKVLADWLSEKLKGKKVQVEIGGKLLSGMEKNDIETAIREELENKDAPK